ncbi:tetratricopeptide repeat protein [bacterium]|nr:tetratricopeptide repeat protein [bacterium]
MSNINRSAISSSLAFATLLISLAAIAFLPDGFTVFPASLKMLSFFAFTSLSFAYFLIVCFRRRHLYLNLSPLTPSLILFSLCLGAAIIATTPTHATASFLGLGGLMIAFSLSAICSSILVKINNSQVATKLTLTVCSLGVVALGVSLANSFFTFLPSSWAQTLNTPGLYQSLMFIGLAGVGANYFKKNKFKTGQLILIPTFIIGLIMSFYLSFQLPATTPSFAASFSTAARALAANNQFSYKRLFLGSKSQNYADIYDQYSLDTDTNHLGRFHQAYCLPLTIFSLYGLLALAAWLILIGQTLYLCFRQEEKNRDLYFILLISFFVQLFTAIYPLILMIQVILITFATNKNRQILLNLNLATFSSEKSTQKVENRDSSSVITMSFGTISSILLIIFILNLARNYQGFYLFERSQQAVLEDNLSDFIDLSARAVKAAPDIDNTNANAAIAETELMLAQLNQDSEQALKHYENAINFIQKAIAIAPTHADNYNKYAQIMQEAYPYLDSQSGFETLADRITHAYGQAALLQPHNPNILLGLGGFYQGTGKLDEALSVYQQALQLDPTSAQSNYQLATLYEQEGETDLALTSYNNVLQLVDADSSDYQAVQAKIKALSE